MCGDPDLPACLYRTAKPGVATAAAARNASRATAPKPARRAASHDGTTPHLGGLGVGGGEAGFVDPRSDARERRCRIVSDDAQELAVTAMIAPSGDRGDLAGDAVPRDAAEELVRRVAENALMAGGSSRGAARMALVIASMSAATRAQDAQRVQVRPQRPQLQHRQLPRQGRAPPGSGRARRRAGFRRRGFRREPSLTETIASATR